MLRTKLKSSWRVVKAVATVMQCSIYTLFHYFPNSDKRDCYATASWLESAEAQQHQAPLCKLILIQAKTLLIMSY